MRRRPRSIERCALSPLDTVSDPWSYLCVDRRRSGGIRAADAVESLLDAGEKRLAALVFEGDAGIGKTTAWLRGLERAAARGASVLVARATPTEAALSFSVLADLLAPVDAGVLDTLAPPQRRALDVALLRAEPSGTALDARATAAGVLTVLRQLAGERPLVLAVDDVQWIDAASGRALEYTLRRLGDARVAVLFTRRSGRAASVPDVVAALPPDTSHHLVEPLGVEELVPVIRPLLGDLFTPALTSRIAEAARGNPLHAITVSRLLGDTADISADVLLPVPDDLRDAVKMQLRRLPQATRELLARFSLQARPTARHDDLSLLAAAEDAEIITVGADGDVTFVHPLMAIAIAHGISLERRRRIHAELAEDAPTNEQRARHLALATRTPNDGIARALDKAALEARSRGAIDVAADMAEHALRLTAPGDFEVLNWRRVRASALALKVGATAHARTLAQAVVDSEIVLAARARALQLLAETMLMEDMHRAALLLAEALTYAGDDLCCAAELHHQLAGLELTQMRPHAAAVHAAQELSLAERAGDDAILGEALAMQSAIDVLTGRPIDRRTCQRAVELEDLDRDGPFQLCASQMVGGAYLYLGALDDARRVYSRLDSHLAANGRDGDRPWVQGQLAQCAWLAGDWAAAAAFVDECLFGADLHGQDIFRGLGLWVRGMLGAERGEVDAARADLNALADIAERTQWVVGAGQAAYGHGHLALLTGDLEGALVHLLPMAELASAIGVYEWCFAIAVPDAVDALAATGRVDEAERHASALDEWGRRGDRVWALAMGARARAVVHEARRELLEAEASCLEALHHHARLGMPVELGRTMLVLGRLQRRRNARREARSQIEQARDLFVGVGATVWAHRAEQELARTGLRRAPDALTPSERQVARSSALGLTNAMVAAQLHVSVRTVEANLARVYRKLGIRSRAELGVAMAALEDGSTPLH